MSLSTLLFAYLLGGVTFLPLLLLGIGYVAWTTLPTVGKEHDDVLDGAEKEKLLEKAVDAAKDDRSPADAAASATFAVLRTYNFSAALATLNAKTNNGPGNGTDGAAEAGGGESMSVYQSMYRSVFDRSRNNLNANPLVEEEEGAPTPGNKARAKPPLGKIFYIVLRHGHLMLYDSPAQLEVRHVISLAHNSISLYDGECSDEDLTEADLFIKRTAIVLEPLLAANSTPTPGQPTASQRPFYLFSSTCSDKEDFYHALLAAQSQPPVPQPIDTDCAIKLQSTLYSTTLTPETQALNALFGRIFLSLHRTPFMENNIREKIEKKMARVQKPSFIAALSLHSIDLGDMVPVLSNPRLKEMHISGDMTVGFDIRYGGGLKVVISALAKLDLGPRFKVRTVDLLLAGSLQRMQGKILVRVKPPPSNRIWFCFDGLPDMEIKVEPVVSSRQITYTFILRAIENRIREVIAETLVKPNWDDIPFFRTAGQVFRGGIWKSEPVDKARARAASENIEKTLYEGSRPTSDLGARNEKTMSMPALPLDSDNNGASSGAQISSALDRNPTAQDSLKRRSVVSLPSQAAQSAAERAVTDRPAAMPRPMRSPSFASPPASAPIVAVDDVSADAVRRDDDTVPPRVNKRWIGRGKETLKRDAVEAIREMRERSLRGEASAAISPTQRPVSGTDQDMLDENDATLLSVPHDELESDPTSGQPSRRASASTLPDPTRSGSTTPERASVSRTNSVRSGNSKLSGQGPGQRKTILGATAAATSAARQWTWNAVVNKKGSPVFRNRNGSADSVASKRQGSPPKEPMGRGQPLPPPGTPLPGPRSGNGLWNAAAAGLGGVGMRRKPVPPPRRTAPPPAPRGKDARLSDSEEVIGKSQAKRASVSTHSEAEGGHGDEDDAGEFGPWHHNEQAEANDRDAEARMGHAATSDAETTSSTATDQQADVVKPKEEVGNESQRTSAPPPLPPRRRTKKNHHAVHPAVMNTQPEMDEPNDEEEDLNNTTDDEIIAIPAPVDSEAEESGTVELEEADGQHVLHAASASVTSEKAEEGHGQDRDPARS